MTTSTQGIFQADVIIRSFFLNAIKDLRANPWLLDYVFASLPQDELTAREYGEKEIDRAKEWFLNTDIPVFMATRVDSSTLPCVTISLVESSESDFTLGDVHYQTAEEFDGPWPTLATFTPVGYSSITGIMTLPELEQNIHAGMMIVDATGRNHTIEEVLDSTTIRLATGTVADFTKAQLKNVGPSHIVELESSVFKETFSIGIHCQGEAVHLTYLHSIVVFALLRYKQALLEARGFERSQFTSTDFNVNPNFEQEIVFSRFINLWGYVRQYWPKSVKHKVMGVEAGLTTSTTGNIKIIGAGSTGLDPNTHAWIGDEDSLSTRVLSSDDDVARSSDFEEGT